jgi:hypothetical protein
MKIKLEFEVEDVMELLCLHAAVMESAVENIGEAPLTYSKAARITNAFFNEAARQMPMEEFERIKNKKTES